MIQIELKLFVTLSRYLPDQAEQYEINDGITIDDLFDDLQIPREQVKLIFINGKKEETTYVLKQNDRVGLFPPVGGG